VAPPQTRQRHPPGNGAGPTDDTLKDRINFRLETSDALHKYDVKVKVDKGVATLRVTSRPPRRRRSRAGWPK
jgi:osmotically-inducible protein OsmY